MRKKNTNKISNKNSTLIIKNCVDGVIIFILILIYKDLHNDSCIDSVRCSISILFFLVYS